MLIFFLIYNGFNYNFLVKLFEMNDFWVFLLSKIFVLVVSCLYLKGVMIVICM